MTLDQHPVWFVRSRPFEPGNIEFTGCGFIDVVSSDMAEIMNAVALGIDGMLDKFAQVVHSNGSPPGATRQRVHVRSHSLTIWPEHADEPGKTRLFLTVIAEYINK